jgi:hypothetical protein
MATSLRKESDRLRSLGRQAVPDFQAAQEVYEALGRLDGGLQRFGTIFDRSRWEAMQDGLAGLEASLEATAGEVERIARYKYPIVRRNGIRIDLEEKPFWPNGERIADGLRRATTGTRAAREELAIASREIPAVRDAIDSSRQTIQRTRQTLGAALKYRKEVESLLNEIPDRTGQYTENFSKLAEQFADSLRQLQALKKFTDGLRQVASTIEKHADDWSQTHSTIQGTAKILHTAARSLDTLTKNRDEYDLFVRQSAQALQDISELFPKISEATEQQLEQSEKTLSELTQHLRYTNDLVPAWVDRAVWCLALLRGLAILGGITLGLVGLSKLTLRATANPLEPSRAA